VLLVVVVSVVVAVNFSAWFAVVPAGLLSVVSSDLNADVKS
jgi:hypothetical protein